MKNQKLAVAMQSLIDSGAADEITKVVLFDALENILEGLERLSKQPDLSEVKLADFSNDIDNGLAISLAARYFSLTFEHEYLDEADKKLAEYALQDNVYKLMAEIKKGIIL